MLRFRISIVITSVEIQDDFDLILHKVDSHKAFRISPWILRFINNCKENKKSGLLRTVELVNQKKIDMNRRKKLVLTDLEMIKGEQT